MRRLFLGLLTAFTLSVTAELAISEGAIYEYINEQGIPSYTNRWEEIPPPYRGRAQVLELNTGTSSKPASPPSVVHRPGWFSEGMTGAVEPPMPGPAKGSFTARWLEWFEALSIPEPSHYQLAVGLMGLVLLGGGFAVRRYIENPGARVLLTLARIGIVVGSLYAIFFSSLNERIADATGEPAHPTVSGQEIVTDAEGMASELDRAVHERAAPIKKLEDAALQDAARFVRGAGGTSEPGPRVRRPSQTTP